MRTSNIIVQEEQKQNFFVSLYNQLKSLIKCECFKSLITLSYNQKPIQIPKQSLQHMGRKTLVIDLDETLVHSSFNYISDPDFILKIKVMNANYTIYVRIRPGVEEFLMKMAEFYEIFIFTASICEYANPVIDRIDSKEVCALRLFRPNCSILNGVFVKDLQKLQRSINNIIIIDNTHTSFSLQPKNAIHIKNYFDDPSDTELLDLIPFLQLISTFDDVRPVGEYWKQYVRSEKIKYTRNGEQYIYDRNRNESYEEMDAINQSINQIKDNQTLLGKQQLKLQTNFAIDYDEVNNLTENDEDIQFRNEQGINSPNLNKSHFNEIDQNDQNL
ncbi:unnamed protein product [Paramecium sonneborni]|uniref:FCP1 homology domain-containing protein n=1 Tax=Paramecium sonneborni TaxID=65129 RepID=A0A8S1LK45_9CILI|nr:unnamed protein product [Paramecium sonneborni]